MKLRLVCLLAACGLFFSDFAFAKVNIAVITPLTGDKTTLGNEITSGVEAAINELNKEGGLLGEKINLIKIEDECNDSLAVSTAQMLALNTDGDYKVSAVIGPYCFNKFNLVTDTLANAKIFQIIPTAVNSAYQEEHGGLIKMVGYQDQQATDFFNYYNETFKSAKTALIFDSNNNQTAQAFQKVFAQHQKSDYLHLYHLEEYDFDYDDLADRLFENGEQLAFILSDERSASNMAEEIKSRKRNFIIFANKYQVMPEYEQTLGKFANTTYFMTLPSLVDRPEFAETLVKLRFLGVQPDGLTVYGYMAVKLWADLVRKAKSFQYTRLSQALKNLSFNSGWGKLMYTNGNPSTPVKYNIYFYQNGEYTQVY